MLRHVAAFVIALGIAPGAPARAEERKAGGEAFASLPKPGSLTVNRGRGEVIIHATVQHPAGKPCIGEWGQRIQAFVGCSKAAGGDATMAGYFVFLADVPTDD